MTSLRAINGSSHGGLDVDACFEVKKAFQAIVTADMRVVLDQACRVEGIVLRLEEVLAGLKGPTLFAFGGLPGDLVSPKVVDNSAAPDGKDTIFVTPPMWQRLDREGVHIDWNSRLQMCGICRTEKAATEFSGKMLKKLRRRGLDSEACCSDCMQFTRAHKSDTTGKRNVSLEADLADGSRKNIGLPDYVDKVFGKSCFPDLVQLKVFPGAKDVSEAYAALHAVWQHFPVASLEGRVLCVCIGDGSTPRSAALASFLTQWHCIAVDPGLRSEWCGEEPKGVHRLHGFCSKVEDFVSTGTASAFARDSSVAPEVLVVLAIHSHHRFLGPASVPAIRAAFGAECAQTCVVSIPCCFPFRDVEDLGRRPDLCYDDWAILSEKRQVRMWFWGGPNDVWQTPAIAS